MSVDSVLVAEGAVLDFVSFAEFVGHNTLLWWTTQKVG